MDTEVTASFQILMHRTYLATSVKSEILWKMFLSQKDFLKNPNKNEQRQAGMKTSYHMFQVKPKLTYLNSLAKIVKREFVFI